MAEISRIFDTRYFLFFFREFSAAFSTLRFAYECPRISGIAPCRSPRLASRKPMDVTFLHTADWQIGKPFATVADDAKRHQLCHERILAISRLGTVARETGASFILVAGDLFDSPHASKATVSAACAAIGGIGLPFIAIPGNHDHGGPGSIWEQEFFRREQHQLAPNLTVITKPAPIVCEGISGTAVILPAPLLRRHEPGDPTAWLRDPAAAGNFPPELPRIALAHGTVQGFDSQPHDEESTTTTPNFIDLARLPEDALDYIALGDWHGVKQTGPKAWYSGTPETDRFPRGEGNRPGHVLAVTASRGKPPRVREIATGNFRWSEIPFHFSDDDGPARLQSLLEETIGTTAGGHLLRLTLTGSLGIAASSRLTTLLESWTARLLRLKLLDQVRTAPAAEEISALASRTADPLIAAVATRLAALAEENSAEASTARAALRELHHTLQQAG